MTLTYIGKKYEGLTKTKRTIDRMDVALNGKVFGCLRGTPIGRTMKWTGFYNNRPVTVCTNSQTQAAVQLLNTLKNHHKEAYAKLTAE
ncbi:hypothetical protein RDJLphi1_gp06 [Roseobacter phage RDJL Phi 1]|uniref:Uncharacterized protein n=1 Tax=Roseobacter phage RDJL Phi 1 TaxID=562742 RepID=F4YXL7_9CAUD|nr:hypothetical protein RDJLphi1_gp06 [Roseobacter phage RDJL Phi 1]ADK73407.1 hypothetical protein RDJLphi1_gp06 [Roseobacter phage RDJL Phi 1]